MDRNLSPVQRLAVRPDQLLTSNGNLRRDGILNWTLPAWKGTLPDGRKYNTCRSASICADLCYARAGTYIFSNTLERHQRNLAYVMDDLHGWTEQMIAEIGRKRGPVIDKVRGRRGPVVIRIHDAGDFFSNAYTKAWLTIMAAHPKVRFYTYTKEVTRFRRLIEPNPPANFKWVYSYGGKQDKRLDERRDRVCDVFPTVEALQAAGYHDQAASDLLAVDGPAPVGMAANNIRHLLKRQGNRTFAELQRQADALAAGGAPGRGASTTTTSSTHRPGPTPTRAVGPTEEPDPWGPLLDELLPATN